MLGNNYSHLMQLDHNSRRKSPPLFFLHFLYSFFSSYFVCNLDARFVLCLALTTGTHALHAPSKRTCCTRYYANNSIVCHASNLWLSLQIGILLLSMEIHRFCCRPFCDVPMPMLSQNFLAHSQ